MPTANDREVAPGALIAVISVLGAVITPPVAAISSLIAVISALATVIRSVVGAAGIQAGIMPLVREKEK